MVNVKKSKACMPIDDHIPNGPGFDKRAPEKPEALGYYEYKAMQFEQLIVKDGGPVSRSIGWNRRGVKQHIVFTKHGAYRWPLSYEDNDEGVPDESMPYRTEDAKVAEALGTPLPDF